jgi:putative endonuclease
VIAPIDRGRIGRRGERAVAWWLRLRGWRLLGRNIRVGPDELDIVAVHPRRRLLAIVEVKSTGTGAGVIDRVDTSKQHRIARAAERLPLSWRRNRMMRFDIATVHVGRWRCRVRYASGAFDDTRR